MLLFSENDVNTSKEHSADTLKRGMTNICVRDTK